MSQSWWQRFRQWRPSSSLAQRRVKRGRDLAFRPRVRELEGRLAPAMFVLHEQMAVVLKRIK
jgi:hypothetical protein